MGLKTNFNPDRDIPDLSGKVILITGGTAGIGRETVLQFARHHARKIFFTGRNDAAAATLITEASTVSSTTETVFLKADHASFSSVARAITRFIDSSDRLDILIFNAGILGGSSEMSPDGFEMQWMVNYMSHALMAKLLMPMLDQTALHFHDARLVTISSESFRNAPKGGVIIEDLMTDQTNLGMMSKWYRYAQSKLGMVLLTKQLANLHPKVRCISIHPGMIETGMVSGLPLIDRLFVKAHIIGKVISVREGAFTTCWGATTPNPEKLESGGIYGPVGVLIRESGYSKDAVLRKQLWDWTVEKLEAYN